MPHTAPKAIFPESYLEVRQLPDPLLEKLGYDLRSDYVEKYWLSVLGPSATFLLRRLRSDLEANSDGYRIDVAALSVELGLGTKGGKNGPLWRSIERLCRFNAATRKGSLLMVRTALPPLSLRHIKRLPPQLRDQHNSTIAARTNTTGVRALTPTTQAVQPAT